MAVDFGRRLRGGMPQELLRDTRMDSRTKEQPS
jgi:hypothetical protein